MKEYDFCFVSLEVKRGALAPPTQSTFKDSSCTSYDFVPPFSLISNWGWGFTFDLIQVSKHIQSSCPIRKVLVYLFTWCTLRS